MGKSIVISNNDLALRTADSGPSDDLLSSLIPSEYIQTLEGALAVRLADLRGVERLAEEMDGTVVILPVHRVGVAVLAAVRIAETGRVAKRGLRAIEEFGQKRQRP